MTTQDAVPRYAECSGDEHCPMCSGEVCNLCGAGCSTPPPAVRCEHDSLERHQYPPAPTQDAVPDDAELDVLDGMLRTGIPLDMERVADTILALRADGKRYRFWRRFYDCRFALKLSGTSLSLSFRPARPDVEVSPEYEKLVDAAIDAARQAAGGP